MMKPSRPAWTLVELIVGLATLAIVFYGMVHGTRFFTRRFAKDDPALDLTREMCHGMERIERDLREARRIIYPPAGGAASRSLVFRDFDGHIISYSHDPARREISRCLLYPAAVSSPAEHFVRGIDRLYFSVSIEGLVSWGLFAGDHVLFGSARRQNR